MKRYYNQSENKWYTEGNTMTRQINAYTVWSGKPTVAQLTEWGYTEYIEPVVESTPYVPTYEELVVQKIRVQYSIDDELAILRQRDTKPQEFTEYNIYCEQCKADAKEELGIEEEEA